MSSRKKMCKIRVSRKDKATSKWWEGVFKELEDQRNIPYVERSEEVLKCIPYKLYERIAPLLGLDTKLQDPREKKKRELRISSAITRHEIPQIEKDHDEGYRDSFLLPDAIHDQVEKDEERPGFGDEDEEDEQACDLDILVKPPTPRHALKKPPETVSPYYSFVRKRGKRAVNWESRYMPKHVLENWEKTLHQRATEKTESIVREFCAWLRGLGGQESALTETALNELFEIGRVDDAAQALMVRVRELYTVTPEVAAAANLPERATRPSLHRQIMRDALESLRPARHFAFGTALPKDMRRHQVATDTTEWMTCRNVPAGLASMRMVWEGITAIRSTRAYCTWLREHPEIEPPEYLERIGMMDPDFGVSKGQPRVSMIPEWTEPEGKRFDEQDISTIDTTQTDPVPQDTAPAHVIDDIEELEAEM